MNDEYPESGPTGPVRDPSWIRDFNGLDDLFVKVGAEDIVRELDHVAQNMEEAQQERDVLVLFKDKEPTLQELYELLDTNHELTLARVIVVASELGSMDILDLCGLLTNIVAAYQGHWPKADVQSELLANTTLSKDIIAALYSVTEELLEGPDIDTSDIGAVTEAVDAKKKDETDWDEVIDRKRDTKARLTSAQGPLISKYNIHPDDPILKDLHSWGATYISIRNNHRQSLARGVTSHHISESLEALRISEDDYYQLLEQVADSISES